MRSTQMFSSALAMCPILLSGQGWLTCMAPNDMVAKPVSKSVLIAPSAADNSENLLKIKDVRL